MRGPARPAMAAAVGPVRVGGIVWVPARTMSLAGIVFLAAVLGVAVCNVVGLRAEEQVVNADAPRVVAPMENPETVGYRPVVEFPGDAGSPETATPSSGGADLPITGRSQTGRPNPAAGSQLGVDGALLVDLLPESRGHRPAPSRQASARPNLARPQVVGVDHRLSSAFASAQPVRASRAGRYATNHSEPAIALSRFVEESTHASALPLGLRQEGIHGATDQFRNGEATGFREAGQRRVLLSCDIEVESVHTVNIQSYPARRKEDPRVYDRL